MKKFIFLLLILISFSIKAQSHDRNNSSKSAPESEIRTALETIYNDDQDIRKQYREMQKKVGFDSPALYELGVKMDRVDSINTIKVINILDTKGWLGKSQVGSKASEALFLVIQHANLEIQKKYLPMMREAAKNGNASLASLALLEDRIALREGRHQIYGSQISSHPTTRELYVLPLLDPDNVDKRRATMGLGPLKDYVANWKIEWNAEEYKKQLPEYEQILKERKQQ